MTPDELTHRRQSEWDRLVDLSRRARHPAALSESELVELGQLYRAATSDLAIAQRDFPRHALTLYLNQLVARVHPLVYQDEPLVARRLIAFYTQGWPQLYRELAPFILAAALLFFGFGALAFAATSTDAGAANYLLPPQTIAMVKSGRLWWKELNGLNQVGSALIMTNNLQVAFLAFAGGILLGLYTLYVLIMNGLSLGAVLGLMQTTGNAPALWEFIVGHGALELSEITMAGGSGLLLGYALWQPGLLSRKDALTLAAQKSVRLLLGSAPLLLVAGVIEGFVSPSAIPAPFKYSIGLATGILLYGYLFLAGRSTSRRPRRLNGWRRLLRKSS